MASGRGKVLTISILAAITAASFAIWLIPMERNMTLVSTDEEALLDSVDGIRGVIQESLYTRYGMMLDGMIAPAEFIVEAQTTSDQVSAQIRQLAASNAGPQWSDSYAEYIDALRALNSMTREMTIVAGSLEEGKSYQDSQDRIDELTDRIIQHIDASNSARP